MFRLSRISMLFPCMILLSSILGCASFHVPFAKKFPKATAADPVVEIVCLWQPGEGNDPDGVPCKGFMGQVLFLSRSSSKPVQVDGEVRIYLFDDQGTSEEQSRPLRVFSFDSGSWDIHLTDSSFGPTYQVFVPYVRRGVSNASCSLRVRLKPKEGPIIFSEFTNMQLSGHKKTLRNDEAKPIIQEEVDRLAAEAMTKELRRTTTISLDGKPQAPEPKVAVQQEVNQAKPETVKQEPAAGKIQLANYESGGEPPPQNPDQDRIRRLEAMVQQLLEQKNQGFAPAATKTPAVQQNPQVSESVDESNQRERMKMTPKSRARREDDEAVRPKAPRRLGHPLEDNPPDDSSSGNENTATDEPGDKSYGQSSSYGTESPRRFNLQGQSSKSAAR